MPTVIILTSSPPPVFARSPTPISPSPFSPGSARAWGTESPRRNRFKSSAVTRHGFPTDSTSARQVLKEKHGELNRCVSSPSRNKFKQLQKDQLEEYKKETSLEAAVSCVGRVLLPDTVEIEQGRQYTPKKSNIDNCGIIAPGSPAPLFLQRAIARRTDWTPPKIPVASDLAGPNEQTPIFPKGLLGSFEYAAIEDNISGKGSSSFDSSKRRRLDQVSHSAGESCVIPKVSKVNLASTKTKKKLGKASNKKPLTITGLATSNFLLNKSVSEESSIQQLLDTQSAADLDVRQVGVLENKVRETQAAVEKLRSSKKNTVQSNLVSPSSALRLFEEQEAIFGSASQLARVEFKAGVKPNRVSDIFTLSDPLSSPLQTQTHSIEATTPQIGTARFRNSRNLWAAAGRDEDNALLHFDDPDFSDTPLVRTAFAGKDVMVQPVTDQGSLGPSPTLARATSSILQQCRPTIIDVDDVIIPEKSPSLQHNFHTSTKQARPRKKDAQQKGDAQTVPQAGCPKPVSAKPRKRSATKPHYAGYSDHDLKKQITAYGFKSIKKREKMIELLDKCWDTKFGANAPVTETAPPAVGYGDILSNIHDVSARPVPKQAKKPRVRKSKDDTEKDVSKEKPKRGRKTGGDDGSTKAATKTPRKRKLAAVARNDENDSSNNIDDHAAKKCSAVDIAVDLVSPEKTPDVRITGLKHTFLPTPPITDLDTVPDAPPNSKDLTNGITAADEMSIGTAMEGVTTMIATPAASAPPDIFEQITRAINHQSFTSNIYLTTPSKAKPTTKAKAKPSQKPTTSSSASSSLHGSSVIQRRNHQTNPTWHEKMLLYDPIILEDLAVWLNTEGLGQIGEDREVGAIEVRTWCENRGVCCLWKGGWRGQKGGASGSGD